MIRVRLITPTAITPCKAYRSDAGFDLFADEDATVTNEGVTVKTGVAIEIPRGYYGRVAERSGLATKNGVHLGAGVIDSGYRGEIKVNMYTVTGTHEVKKGDKIAQLIVETIHPCFELKVVDELSETSRGSAGFGSTGSFYQRPLFDDPMYAT